MPGVSFHHPQMLLLLLLLPLVWKYLTNQRPTVSSMLRMLFAALVVLTLARPRLHVESPGRDLVLLVDRSASCGQEAERMLRELWPLIRRDEGADDRTAIVSFGDGALVERGFSSESPMSVLPDDFIFASDVSAAVRTAAAMRRPDRRTAILCLSDGKYTGESPMSPAVAAELEALPFWYRALGGGASADVAAGEIGLPDEVEPRAAWIVRYAIHSSSPARARYVLTRNGLTIAGGETELKRGINHFVARDTADSDGMLEYRLNVRAENDAVRENDVSSAILRVKGAPRVLLVSHAEGGLLENALRGAAIPIDRIGPTSFPDSPAQLTPYRLIALENCRITDFPGRGAESLAEAVEAGLTSLLVTGGPNSFGMGGYHRSAVDPLLPVELELRNEKRRGSLALVIALDRSGSMTMSAGGGRSKMDLANLGAAESIRLLSPQDQVSVIAVDSSPHIIVPLSVADNVEPLVSRTLAIQSMGGGIYCYAALKAAEEEIRKSNISNRHIVLFADASDAEDQEGCYDLAKKLNRDGIKLSVIAMGLPTDSDADFLRELARLGGGEALFSNHAQGLPALFTQEVMRLSRRGFIEERVTPRFLQTLPTLGVVGDAPAFRLDGFNVASAREGAVVYMNLDDEFSTPLLATRVAGRSQTGAALFELDGAFSGTFPGWRAAPGLLVALARRLASGVDLSEAKAYSRIGKGTAEVVLELSEDTAAAARNGESTVKWMGPGGVTESTALTWLGPDRAKAEVKMAAPGYYLPLIELSGGGLVAAPPVSLSYSHEFAPDSGVGGLSTLQDLAGISGGGDGLDITEVRRSGRAVRMGGTELTSYLLHLLLLLFLVELSGRRLAWFG